MNGKNLREGESERGRDRIGKMEWEKERVCA